MSGIGERGRTRRDLSRQQDEARVSKDLTALQKGSGKTGWSKKRPGSGKVKI